MNVLGITGRLLNFPLSLIGHIRGGLTTSRSWRARSLPECQGRPLPTPTLVEIAQTYGIDLIHLHLGVVMTPNLTTGPLTPPVVRNLHIVSELAKISFSRMVRSVIPTLVPLLISLLIFIYLPLNVLWLPNLLLK